MSNSFLSHQSITATAEHGSILHIGYCLFQTQNVGYLETWSVWAANAHVGEELPFIKETQHLDRKSVV